MKCNEALGNLPQALDCRDWRMMLPRPKVGKACTQAYDDAAFAVCTARCEGREPPRKEALTGNFCREYTAKTPKPTMGKSCRKCRWARTCPRRRQCCLQQPWRPRPHRRAQRIASCAIWCG